MEITLGQVRNPRVQGHRYNPEIWKKNRLNSRLRIVTGPSEISVIDPKCISAILGSSSKCGRAPWSDNSFPARSVFETRDENEHRARRRVWDQALGPKMLELYQPRVSRHAEELERQFLAAAGRPVNVARSLNFYAFDVMGDVAFGKSFGMLETGERHFVLSLLEKGQTPLGVFGPLPWLFTILTRIPFVSRDIQTFVRWCREQRATRKTVSFSLFVIGY